MVIKSSDFRCVVQSELSVIKPRELIRYYNLIIYMTRVSHLLHPLSLSHLRDLSTPTLTANLPPSFLPPTLAVLAWPLPHVPLDPLRQTNQQRDLQAQFV